MNNIQLCDVTILQSGGDFTLSFNEKLKLARLLDKLQVSAIDLPPVNDARTDSLLVKSIASAVSFARVALPVRLDGSAAAGVEAAWSALSGAARPRLQVRVPVSSVQMEYIFHKKPDAVIRLVSEAITLCKARTDDVEFIADDATRADAAFLARIADAAVAAGASVVTLCDSAGEMLPDEFAAFVSGVYEAVPALRTVTLGVACDDACAMADACAIAAVRCGAALIKASACPVSCVSLPHAARLIARRGELLGRIDLRVTELDDDVKKIVWLCRTDKSEGSPFENGVRTDSGTALSVTADRGAVERAVRGLGYDLSPADVDRVAASVQAFAGQRETVTDRELNAIVASVSMQVPSAWTMDNYVVNIGSGITAMAHVRLAHNGHVTEAVSLGDGPIDAAFLAIEQIVGRHYELDDFQIQSVTEGREAMGEAVVCLRSGGKLFSGRGLSVDIVGASIHAYVNALNKIAYEEAGV